MQKTKTYIKNLIQAIKGNNVLKIQYVETALRKADLEKIKQLSSHTPYTVTDSLALVAYKAGQADLIRMIETQLLTQQAQL